MNYMEQVAKIIGVQFGEKFQIRDYNNESFRIQHNGLVDNMNRLRDRLLIQLLLGNASVGKIPWKPKKSEHYFYIDEDGNVILTENCRYLKDILVIKIGNCFKTKEEITPEIIKKYTDFFNDDERIIEI